MQFSHWTDEDIIDRFLEGMNFGRLARMTGRTIPEIKRIITRSEPCNS
jgi:hypothetical protein